MIEVKNLTKKYGNKLAVGGVSFTVPHGEILGFLGPNGAGKTTTMNILTGYLSATSGSCSINGYDILSKPDQAKRQIGYLPEQPPLYLDMTVRDYLNFAYSLKGIKMIRQKHIDECMELVKITDVQKRLIKNLSKGYRQRVGLAQSLLGNPEILILDEPTVGLDPKQINEIRDLIKSLGKTRTIILSSHILPEVSAICERVIIINNGVLVASDTPDNLAQSLSGRNTVIARVCGNRQNVAAIIEKVEGVTSVSHRSCNDEGASEYTIETTGQHDIRRALFYALAKNDMPIIMMNNAALTLEEVFLKVTRDSARSIAVDETGETQDGGDQTEIVDVVAGEEHTS